MRIYTFRLKPDELLFERIQAFVEEKGIEAGVILGCVGSLTRAAIRYANQEVITFLEGKFEIVSMTGTVSLHGSHVHLSVSDGKGRTYGGHLSDGCHVYTTAEIIIGEVEDVVYLREMCPESGYPELVVRDKE